MLNNPEPVRRKIRRGVIFTAEEVEAIRYARIESIANAEFDNNSALVTALESAFDKITQSLDTKE